MLAVVGTAYSRKQSEQSKGADTAAQGKDGKQVNESGYAAGQTEGMSQISEFTLDSTVKEVISDSAFGNFGRLLFPVDRMVSEDDTLSEISSSDVYVWYSNIQPEKTVEIVNHLKARADAGEQIYSEEEISKDASKADTGLFYFGGAQEEKFAIMNAGGGFMYVGRCTTVFPMHWKSAKGVTIHLR